MSTNWCSSKIMLGIARMVMATAFCSVLLNENRVLSVKLEEKTDSTTKDHHSGECQILM